MTRRSQRFRMTLTAGLGLLVAVGAVSASDDSGRRGGVRSKQVRPAVPVAVSEESPVSWAMSPRPDGDLGFDLAELDDCHVGDVIEISLGALGVDRFEIRDARRERGTDRWWRLVSIDHAEGVGTLARSGDMVAGWIQSPAFGDEFEWTFEPMGPGRLRPTPKSPDLPGCGGVIDPPGGIVDAPARLGMGPFAPESFRDDRPVGRFAGEDDDPVCAGCSSLVADLAFFYTPAVLEAVEQELQDAGSDPEDAETAIGAKCLLECANTTQAMENSDLSFGVRSVHVGLVDWEDETSGEILGKFASPDDGEMDEIHLVRAEVGADACSLITISDGGAGYCGVAYLGNGNSPGSAFNNLIWGCMGFSLLAHEFGHNIGACHAAGDGGGCDEATGCDPWGGPLGAECCRPDATGPNSGAPRFNVGWRWVNPAQVPACRRTLMAYGPGVRSLNYSNPDVQLAGVATGSSEDSADGRWADNARVIRATMPGTVSYFCEVPEPSGSDGRLVAGSLGDFDNFGSVLATNGVRMFAGASRHDSQGLNAGAVFVFADALEKDPDLPNLGWLQDGKLATPDLEDGELFGASVSASGDLLAVGAPYASRFVTEIGDDGEEVVVETFPLAGRAEIWIDDGAGYCRASIIQPEELDANDLFGAAVAVAGDLVAIGAPFRDVGGGVDRGVVFVYQRTGTDTFELLETIEGQVPGDRLGETLAMGVLGNEFDQMLLIGAPFGGNDRGFVQPILYLRGGDVFVSEPGTRLNGSLAGDRFGGALAIYGDDVVIGAPLSRGTSGSAKAYRFTGTSLSLVALLSTPGGGSEGDRFGASVAIGDVRMVIGAPDVDVPDPSDPDENLRDDVGAVFIYGRDGNGWENIDLFQPSGLQPGDRCGTSTAIAGTVLFAGAPDADDAGILSGVVYASYEEFEDCNENGIEDSLDIYLQTSTDENLDGIPDECVPGLCTADIDRSGVVDGADLGLLFVAWGSCPEGEPGCPGDLDEDGLVNGSDLGLLCLAWGQICDEPRP
ncbi:MAG: hypothetical protein GY895_03195 [Phycisphaera sp.]|nr:hypothetical protein [Phycisphaera sp.]